MDDDPVLRSLTADVEREDPALAALLSGLADPRPRHRHVLLWLLVATSGAVLAVLLPVTVTVGLGALLLVLAAPVVAWRCAATVDDLRPRLP